MTYEELFERLGIANTKVQDKIRDSFAEDEIDAAKDFVSGKIEFNSNVILTESDDPNAEPNEESVTVLTKPAFDRESNGFTAYALTQDGDLIKAWWTLPQGEENTVSVRADFGGEQSETKRFLCSKTDNGTEQLQDSMIEEGLRVPEDRREEFESLVNTVEETPDLKEFGIAEAISPASAGEMLEKAKEAGFIEEYDIGEIPLEERKAAFKPAIYAIDAYDTIAYSEPEYVPGSKYENDRYLVKVLDKEQFGTEEGANLRQWCEEHGTDKAVFVQKKPRASESYYDMPARIYAYDKESIRKSEKDFRPHDDMPWVYPSTVKLERYLDAVSENAPEHGDTGKAESRTLNPNEATVLRITDFATLDKVQNALKQFENDIRMPEYGAEPDHILRETHGAWPINCVGGTLQLVTKKDAKIKSQLKFTPYLTNVKISFEEFNGKSGEEIYDMFRKKTLTEAKKTDADEIVKDVRKMMKEGGVSAEFTDEEGFKQEVNDWKRCCTEDLLTGYVEPQPKPTEAPVKKNEVKPEKGMKQDQDLDLE